MKYKTKPCEIEAKEWNGKTERATEILDWSEGKIDVVLPNKLLIKTLEGEMTASIGDFIIKGLNGEFYPCKPDIFDKKYELVDTSSK